MNISSYNIEPTIEFHAGSSFTQSFKIFNNDGIDSINLTRLYRIEFRICRYGTFNEKLLSFRNTDNVQGMPRIEIDLKDPSILHIHFYSNDTEYFEENLYAYQIISISSSGNKDAVIGQGRMMIYEQIR